MKHFLLLAFTCLIPTVAWCETVTVRPEITDEALVNPGMGWVCFHYSNRLWAYGSQCEPGDTLDWFPGTSTIYFRIPWCYLEPEEGKFRWDIIDTYAQPWIAKGKKIAFRITCCENRFKYATPQWVRDAGAKGIEYTFATFRARPSDEPLWEPDYTDPVFLEKLDHFLAAMARRYNGNPHVAFIDVGTFGMWGEGHTGGTSKLSRERTDEVVKIHMDLHKKHFPDTYVVISDDVSGNRAKTVEEAPAMAYALAHGIGFRDDSILVERPPRSWHHAEMARQFAATLPVVVEHEHYGLSRDKGAWDRELLLKSVEEYQASYLSIHWWPKAFYEENADIIKRINLRLGYRLQPRSVSYPNVIRRDEPVKISVTWANVGVAPCYGGGFPAFTLCDDQGNIVWSWTDETFNVKDLPPTLAGPAKEVTHTTECRFGRITPIPQINDGVFTYTQDNGPAGLDGNVPTLKPGKYTLYLSVGQRDGTPEIALPLPATASRRYPLGTVEIP
ncbi:MAG: DUF4832 domain-containing protein [Planctomycetia bacterium]|nr:DUF4832 domain-containing protein [Planctomycetia bacterium]